MSIPHDSRAPNRQQRFIEIYNADDTSIPAHGVVEIIGGDAYLTDNSTVVQVRRPTKDGSPHVLINGLVPLTPGSSCQVATNDFPAWALCDDDQPLTGQMWGAVKDSYKLGRGRQGFIVVDSHDLANGETVARVTRHERVFRVTSTEGPFYPGSSQSCDFHRWDGSNWVVTGTSATVNDPFFRTFALEDEHIFVENYGDEWFTMVEQGLRREGEVVSGSNGTYLVTLFASAPSVSCTGSDTGIIITACYLGCTELTAGDRVWVHYHPEFRAWKAMPLCVSGLIRFEMLTALPLGGKGTAIEIGTGTTYTQIGSSFPIKDPHRNPGSWRFDPKSTPSSQVRGYMGWCVIPANPEIHASGVPYREIVYMEQIARSIEFELSADMSGGRALAEVTNYYLGKDPMLSDLNQWSRLYVYDSQGNYPRALEGALGKARYNDRDHQYEVCECDQQAILLRATISEMCPGDATGGVISYTPATFPPYGMTPTNVGSADNIHKLSNSGAKTATLMWDDGSSRYVVLQVEHEPQFVVTSSVLSQDGCEIASTIGTLYMSVMFCGDLEESETTVAFTEEEIVTDITLEHTQGSAGSGNDPPSEGSCRYNIEKKTLCTLVPTAPQTTNSYINMEPVLVVQDIYVDGINIGATVAVAYVNCLDNQDDLTVIYGTNCSSGSS